VTAIDPLLLRHRIAAAVAGVAVVSVALLAWLGYVAVREWQQSASVLAERAAGEASEVLLTGMTRDMRAVQRSVLASPALDSISLRPPYEAINIVAGALGRYGYPESFFLWRSEAPGAGMFMHRRDRPPQWARPVADRNRFPLTVESNPPGLHELLNRLRVDARQGRRFSVFEASISGVPYQVVARLFYRDELALELDAVLGFTVNLDWVRRHYFDELLREDIWTRGARADVLLAIVDEQARLVASTGLASVIPAVPDAQHTFPLMFFNPQLIAADPPADLPRYSWTLSGTVRGDSSLVAAQSAGNRMLMLQAIAAAALAIGLALTMRASRASIRLASLQAEFVSSVTHEFKTPISTIQAAASSLVAGRISSADAQQEYAGFIVQEAQRLTRLVDNLLAFSKITDSTVRPHLEPVALAPLINECLRRFRPQFATRQFAVRADVPDDLPTIVGDRSALELMLDNLIDNVLRHSRKARDLRLTAFERDHHVVIEVADRGGGIADDEVDLVTDRFYRGREAGDGGTGLGLSIVERITSDHAGTLDIRSEPGVGTTVTVTLPITLHHQPRDSASQPTSAS
jgi:signal transduction histidine kinase